MSTTLTDPPAALPRITYDHSTITVEELAIRQLKQHPNFCGRVHTINVEYRSGTLILSGQLPSFYLKQVLQEVLRHVDDVRNIDNRVDVVCPNGLSS